MSRRRAPSAFRTPISRVRSVTETSMMFMMPMPPTSSDTRRCRRAGRRRSRVVAWNVSSSVVWLRMLKSLGYAPGAAGARARSTESTSLIAASIRCAAVACDIRSISTRSVAEDTHLRGGERDVDVVVRIAEAHLRPWPASLRSPRR